MNDIIGKKHLKEGDRLFSASKSRYYIFVGCSGDYISTIECDYKGNINKDALIEINNVKVFAGEFLHKSPLDQKNVYNLVDLDGNIHFTYS